MGDIFSEAYKSATVFVLPSNEKTNWVGGKFLGFTFPFPSKFFGEKKGLFFSDVQCF